MKGKGKKIVLGILCAIFLVGCGAKEAENNDGVVQDINPGDQSVISSPARQDNQRTVEERPL